jgi:hypothetical protein
MAKEKETKTVKTLEPTETEQMKLENLQLKALLFQTRGVNAQKEVESQNQNFQAAVKALNEYGQEVIKAHDCNSEDVNFDANTLKFTCK